MHVIQEAPLRAAAENGRLEVVQALLAAGADVHAKHEAALREAARLGRLQVSAIVGWLGGWLSEWVLVGWLGG